MNKSWREVAPLAGPWSFGTLAVIVAFCTTWLAWPIWSSITAPDRDTISYLTPYLLAALISLLVLLIWALRRDTGRAAAFAPVFLLAALDVGIRLFLSPGEGGLEPVFALPLLAGAALGAPAGFLTGALACLGSSIPLGLVAEPLVGQIFVWGLWGAVGGLLRPVTTRWAWPLAALLCLPLGVLSGLVLNIIGWTGESTVEAGGFLPGVGALESLGRFVDYAVATSLTVDVVRGVTNALVVALIGLPLLRALRPAALHTGAAPASYSPAVPRVRPDAVDRRQRSDRLSALWTPNEGEPDD